MKFRMRVDNGLRVQVYIAIGDPVALEEAAYDAGELGVTLMVLS